MIIIIVIIIVLVLVIIIIPADVIVPLAVLGDV